VHLHRFSRNDFLAPESFGATIETPGQVAGFVEHACHSSPTAGLEDREAWLIERLELVSMFRFVETRIYVLANLPRMDQLSEDNVPTRPLDEFERSALARLQTQEDLVISRQAGRYRMLGSLRAAHQRLDCHAAKRGELLGAFSCVLRRATTEELRDEVAAEKGVSRSVNGH